MKSVFLDTGYVIALEAADDQHHENAVNHWREIGPENTSIVTTTYVFDECVTFFNGRGHHAKAVEIGQRLRKSPRVEVVPETSTLLEHTVGGRLGPLPGSSRQAVFAHGLLLVRRHGPSGPGPCANVR